MSCDANNPCAIDVLNGSVFVDGRASLVVKQPCVHLTCPEDDIRVNTLSGELQSVRFFSQARTSVSSCVQGGIMSLCAQKFANVVLSSADDPSCGEGSTYCVPDSGALLALGKPIITLRPGEKVQWGWVEKFSTIWASVGLLVILLALVVTFS